MNIALLADDGKKELMVQYCIAYCGILSDHTLYLHDKQGAQQIGARIAYNEIDLVLYFCDPANPDGFESVNKLARLCDQYLVPMATNAATAEVLIQGLRRGDLDWRDIVNPKKK